MDNNTLIHFGVKERSGRYPYGSGDDPFQRIKRAGFSKNKKKKIIKKAQQEVREKSVSEMTDKELEKRTARLKLESNYEKEKTNLESYNKKTSSAPVTSYRGKTVSEMTDEELGAFITRLKLEQQVAELTKKPEVKKGKNWFIENVKNAAKESSAEVLNQSFTWVLGEGINKMTGQKIYVRKKPK